MLTPADDAHHINKHNFKAPFVCGCRDLGEALRRISEGAAMIRTKVRGLRPCAWRSAPEACMHACILLLQPGRSFGHSAYTQQVPGKCQQMPCNSLGLGFECTP